MDSLSSTRNFRYPDRNGVTACHVCRHYQMTETIQHIHKLVHQLHLINDDIIEVIILILLNIVEYSIGFLSSLFMRSSRSMRIMWSATPIIWGMIEQDVQQIRLHIWDSCHHLDKAILTAFYQLLQISISYLHRSYYILPILATFCDAKITFFILLHKFYIKKLPILTLF